MSRRPLPRGRFVRHRRPIGQPLPSDRFGVLVGTYHHQSLTPQGKSAPDDNHVYLWVKVPDAPGRAGGTYECAFNIHSTLGSLVQFAEMEEELEDADLPEPGFYPTTLSYRDLELTDLDFSPVRDGDLHILVSQYAERCDRMAAYGTTYDDGTGMHDLHMNSGERRGSWHKREERSGEDGALVFYFRRSRSPALIARWVCIKFATQTLTDVQG